MRGIIILCSDYLPHPRLTIYSPTCASLFTVFIDDNNPASKHSLPCPHALSPLPACTLAPAHMHPRPCPHAFVAPARMHPRPFPQAPSPLPACTASSHRIIKRVLDKPLSFYSCLLQSHHCRMSIIHSLGHGSL